MTKALTKQEPFQIVPTNMAEAFQLAEYIAKSDLAPKDFKGKPENVLIAMQLGAEVGLRPMQAIQNVAVINGRPSLWGDALLGICQAHPEFTSIKEYFDKDEAVCIVKRKGYDAHEQRFGDKDMIQAGYEKKTGPWQTARKRMKQMRARGFCLRDTFADALKGFIPIEEAIDYEPVQVFATVSEPKTDQGNKILDKIAPSKETIAPEVIEEEKEASPLVFDDEGDQDKATAPEGESESLQASVEEDFMPPEEELKTPPYDGSHDDLFSSVVDQFKGDEKLARGWIKSLFGEERIKTMASYKALPQKDLQFIWDRLMELPQREE